MNALGKNYFKILASVYAFALVVCTIARSLLVYRFTDYTTGFYTAKNGIIVLFNVIYCAAILLMLFMSILRKTDHDYPVHIASRASGIFAVLLALSIAAYTLLEKAYSTMEQNYSATAIAIRGNIALVLGLIAALSFLVYASQRISGKLGNAAPLLGLIPTLWQAYLIVTRFNAYTTITSIPDNLLAVLFMVAASIFFIGHARTTFGFARKDGRNYTIPIGLCLSLTGFLLVVPNYVSMIAKRIPMPANMLGIWESVYVLVLSIYALVFVIDMSRSIKYV